MAAKCLVVLSGIIAEEETGTFRVNYGAAVNEPIANWSGTFTPDVSQALNVNIVNLKNQALIDAQSQAPEAQLTINDVIVFGAPV